MGLDGTGGLLALAGKAGLGFGVGFSSGMSRSMSSVLRYSGCSKSCQSSLNSLLGWSLISTYCSGLSVCLRKSKSVKFHFGSVQQQKISKSNNLMQLWFSSLITWVCLLLVLSVLSCLHSTHYRIIICDINFKIEF